MTPHYIVHALFVLGGVVALLASVCNWNWFFTANNTQFIVRNVGRGRARLFYGVIGVVVIAMAVYFFLATREALDN